MPSILARSDLQITTVVSQTAEYQNDVQSRGSTFEIRMPSQDRRAVELA